MLDSRAEERHIAHSLFSFKEKYDWLWTRVSIWYSVLFNTQLELKQLNIETVSVTAIKMFRFNTVNSLHRLYISDPPNYSM